MYNIDEIRCDFPILERKVYGKPLVYLDNGATAQKPRAVIEAMDNILTVSNSNIHRGVHRLSMETTELYEQARETIRSFINAGSKEEVVFTSGATAAINTVAYGYAANILKKGDNLIISEMEHHSNIVPWQIICQKTGAEIRVLPFDNDGRLQVEDLENLIDNNTKLVAVTQVSNVLGTVNPLKKIISVAHSAGVPVLVDGCQGIVHEHTDVAEMDCDFYAFSGHKLYGPTGIGVLYGKKEYLEMMQPFMGGGDMVHTVRFTGTTFADLPLKFEAGTANYIGAVGMAEGIKYVMGIGVKDIAEHENHLLDFTTQGLNNIPGLRIFGNQPGKSPIISFIIDGIHPTDIGMILDKMGIAVRTGNHCAEPVMDHFGVPGMCRASFALYNTIAEADAFVRGVEKAASMLR